MGPRSLIIAAQAAAVALLILVVYVTLLRPESGSQLPHIQAPGAAPQAQSPGAGGRSRGGQAGEPGPGAGGGGGLEGPIVAGGAAVAPTVGSTGGGGDSPAFRGLTPPADQYADAVSALLSKVRDAPGASAASAIPAADR